MQAVNPYLNFNGNTEEAFKFYQSVFGGELSLFRFKDIPPGDDHPPIAPDVADKVMHVSLPIGKGNVLMGTDAIESMGHVATFGTNFSISLAPESEKEADTIFAKLSAGGKATMPMAKQFWGYFGACTDKFGVQWMVNYDPNSK